MGTEVGVDSAGQTTEPNVRIYEEVRLVLLFSYLCPLSLCRCFPLTRSFSQTHHCLRVPAALRCSMCVLPSYRRCTATSQH